MNRLLQVAPIVAGLLFLGTAAWDCLVRQHVEGDKNYVNVIFADRGMTTPRTSIPLNQVQSHLDSTPTLQAIRGSATAYTPIVRWAKTYFVDFVDGERNRTVRGYVAPATEYEITEGAVRLRRSWLNIAFMVLGAALATLGSVVLTTASASCAKWLVGLGMIRLSSLFWHFSIFGYYSIHATDESLYLNVARKILDWSVQHEKYEFTVGNPLLYLPGLIWNGQSSDVAFAAVYSWLYFLLFGMGILCCIVYGIWTFISPALARRAGLCIVLYPWLMHINHRSDYIFSYLGLKLNDPLPFLSVEFYYFTDFVGYNIMSDSPALFFGLVGLLALYQNTTAGRNCFWAGLALGFSAIVRLTNVFYLVPAAAIFLYRRRNLNATMMATFCIGFAAGATPLGIWNWAIFGSPLKLGYSLMPDVYKGFVWSSVPAGVDIIGAMHQQLLMLSALGILVGTRWGLKIRLLMSLLILPLVLYYTGFPWITFIPVRYILLPLTTMMVCSAFLVPCWAASAIKNEKILWRPESQFGMRRAALAPTGEETSFKIDALNVLALVTAVVFIPGVPYMLYRIPVPAWVPWSVFVSGAAFSWIWARSAVHSIFFVIMAAGTPLVSYGALVCSCVGVWIAALARIVSSRQDESLLGQSTVPGANTFGK